MASDLTCGSGLPVNAPASKPRDTSNLNVVAAYRKSHRHLQHRLNFSSKYFNHCSNRQKPKVGRLGQWPKRYDNNRNVKM